MHRSCILILCCLASGALAKEPPRKAETQVTTKGCEWAGPGFAKAEGSDTCVKVSGAVRAEFETSK